MYKTFKENVLSEKEFKKSEIEIQKSLFIGYGFAIKEKKDAEMYLSLIKKTHHKASHVCYAYILNNPPMQKSNDDGEPSSSAGIPILTCLKKNNYSNVLVIVVRYFGGIKLGSGGLIRAYSNACAKTIQNMDTIIVKDAMCYEIEFKYNYINVIDNYFSKNNIIPINKIFNENVVYKFYCEITNIIDELNNLCLGDLKILDKSIIEIKIEEKKS